MMMGVRDGVSWVVAMAVCAAAGCTLTAGYGGCSSDEQNARATGSGGSAAGTGGSGGSGGSAAGTGGSGGGVAGTGDSGGYYQPTGNGKRIGEAEACDRLTKAVKSNYARLQCTSPVPTCPSYIRSSMAPACSEYDEGAVNGCVSYFGTYSTCEDFGNRPCIVLYFADSAPNGCPPTEAGPDSPGADAVAD
jgi:hypothetical protein